MGTDAGTEAGSDAAPEAEADAGTEAGAEAEAGPEGGTEAGAETGAEAGGRRRVFVSSTTYTGLLDPTSSAPNGVDDGDKACNALAQGAGLGGSWRAFLAGYKYPPGAVSAVDHIADASPWYLVDGTTLVFADKAALSGAAANPLDRDESGRPLPAGAFAWTGQPGTLMFCNAWTSESPNNDGQIGQVGSTTEWAVSTAPATMPCTQQNHIYCFEQ
jgi:hypothetical protein